MNCKLCNSPIDKNRKFCNKSCAASFNNKNFPKRSKTKRCLGCMNLVASCRKYCPECISQKKHFNGTPITPDRTIQSMITKGQNQNRYNHIRQHSRKMIGEVQKLCCVCGYSNHVEVCHIRDISDFPIEATLGEVNSLENLTLLCPNHHWEFDNGFLEL